MDKTLFHRLTDKDFENKTATCSICGPNTPMYSKKDNKGAACLISERKRRKEYSRRVYDPAKNREEKLVRYFKMTQTDYDKMFSEQGNACLICKSKTSGKKGFAIDHDRNCCPGIKTCGNCVRGILCSYCNVGLGHFKDDIEFLENAINYLKNSKK